MPRHPSGCAAALGFVLGDHHGMTRAGPSDDVAGLTPVRQWGEWAPGARLAVPVIVAVVVLANLVGVATVTLLLLGVDDGSSAGRMPVLLASAAYLLVALPVGTLLGARPQRGTNRWLVARRPPTVPEARRALR